MMKKYLRAGVCVLAAITALALAGCPGSESPAGQSGEKQILAFAVTVGGQTVQGTIDQTAHTIAITLPAGTAKTALAPAITLSGGATVSPVSGAAQDFTNPVKYTVTAENGTTQDYTVTVTVEPPTDTPPNKTALNAAIAAANAAKADVVPDTAAENLLPGTWWATQEALDALNTAIGAAETLAAKEDAAQAELDAGVTALTTATTTFNNAKKEGTKRTGSAAVTLRAPGALADEAEGALNITTVRIYKQGTQDNGVTITADLTNLSGATVEWFLDSESLGNAESVTLAAINYFPGAHHLSLEVSATDGTVWSRELSVIVDSGSKGE
jgi:hypothetical protein